MFLYFNYNRSGSQRTSLTYHRRLEWCWVFFCAPNRHDNSGSALDPTGHEESAANFCNVRCLEKTCRGWLIFELSVAVPRQFPAKRHSAGKKTGLPWLKTALNINAGFNTPARKLYDSPILRRCFFRLAVLKSGIKEVLIRNWIRTFLFLGKIGTQVAEVKCPAGCDDIFLTFQPLPDKLHYGETVVVKKFLKKFRPRSRDFVFIGLL
jgi:hypothetical protein